jgi:hypothetical protein
VHQAFSETASNGHLEMLDIPPLVLHTQNDPIVPVRSSVANSFQPMTCAKDSS